MIGESTCLLLSNVSFIACHRMHPPLYIQAKAPNFSVANKSLDATFMIMTFHCLPQSIKAQGPFLEKLFLQTDKPPLFEPLLLLVHLAVIG